MRRKKVEGVILIGVVSGLIILGLAIIGIDRIGKVSPSFSSRTSSCTKNGPLIWSHEHPQDWKASKGKVFINEMGGVYALDEKTGSMIWSFKSNDYVKLGITIKYGKVFATSLTSPKDAIYALDQETG